MRARLAGWALASMMLAVSQAPAGERPSIDGWPSFAVGKLNVLNGGFCTATLIAPDRALTAASCLRDRHAGSWLPVARLHVEFAPYRAGRLGHAPVTAIRPAPGLAFDAAGRPADPARDWAILDLGEGPRDPRIRPLRLATSSQRAQLAAGGSLVLVGYTRTRPYIATLAEPCAIRDRRGDPEIVLHDCAGDVAAAGSAVLLDTPAGPALAGIEVGAGMLDDRPVGVAALLRPVLDVGTLAGGDAAARSVTPP